MSNKHEQCYVQVQREAIMFLWPSQAPLICPPFFGDVHLAASDPASIIPFE